MLSPCLRGQQINGCLFAGDAGSGAVGRRHGLWRDPAVRGGLPCLRGWRQGIRHGAVPRGALPQGAGLLLVPPWMAFWNWLSWHTFLGIGLLRYMAAACSGQRANSISLLNCAPSGECRSEKTLPQLLVLPANACSSKKRGYAAGASGDLQDFRHHCTTAPISRCRSNSEFAAGER